MPKLRFENVRFYQTVIIIIKFNFLDFSSDDFTRKFNNISNYFRFKCLII